MFLPFLTYENVDWRFLAGLDRHKTPISDFLVTKFAAEARDIALDVNRAGELFDQTELAIAFGFAHKRAENRPDIWMPVGRFIWQNGGQRLDDELKRIEELPVSDAFFKAGIVGETKEIAAVTIPKIRQFHRRVANHYPF